MSNTHSNLREDLLSEVRMEHLGTLFVWRAETERANLQYRRVSFLSAANALHDPLVVSRSPLGSERRTWIGCTAGETSLLLAVEAAIEEDWVRILSARYATQEEARDQCTP